MHLGATYCLWGAEQVLHPLISRCGLSGSKTLQPSPCLQDGLIVHVVGDGQVGHEALPR